MLVHLLYCSALSFASNTLSGMIPSTISSLTQLQCVFARFGLLNLVVSIREGVVESLGVDCVTRSFSYCNNSFTNTSVSLIWISTMPYFRYEWVCASPMNGRLDHFGDTDLVCLSFSSTHSSFAVCSITPLPAAELSALGDLYRNTSGSSWANRTGWNVSADPCSGYLYGVVCSGTAINHVA